MWARQLVNEASLEGSAFDSDPGFDGPHQVSASSSCFLSQNHHSETTVMCRDIPNNCAREPLNLQFAGPFDFLYMTVEYMGCALLGLRDIPFGCGNTFWACMISCICLWTLRRHTGYAFLLAVDIRDALHSVTVSPERFGGGSVVPKTVRNRRGAWRHVHVPRWVWAHDTGNHCWLSSRSSSRSLYQQREGTGYVLEVRRFHRFLLCSDIVCVTVSWSEGYFTPDGLYGSRLDSFSSAYDYIDNMFVHVCDVQRA